MKKNLLIIAALLSGAAVAQDTTRTPLVDGVYTIEEASWQTDGAYRSVTFDTPFEISGDWALSLTLDVNAATGSNQWGTTLLATGKDPFAASYNGGFQLYVQVSGNISLKGGIGDISGSSDHKVGTAPLATLGTYTLDLSHIGTVLTASIKDAQGTEVASSTLNNVTWAEGTTVDHFTTTLTDNQQANGWTLPTGTLALVPEPTTATLSLLALAGLALRRRRK